MTDIYCIPKLEELEEFYQFSKEYNVAFEYNDFFVPDVIMNKKMTDKIIDKYKSLDRDRSRDTLHGAFYDIVVNSEDPEICEISRKRVRQSMDIAKSLGLAAVIFHTNYITNFKLACYRKTWIDRNEKFWREIISEYRGIKVYIENMFDESPDMLYELAVRMEDETDFGVCFDFAHAYISGTPVEEWVERLGKYIRHVHVNDNDGVEDEHLPLGEGSFSWKTYRECLGKMKNKPTVLMEVRGIEATRKSRDFMEREGLL